MEFAEILKEKRMASGMSRRQLSELTYISTSTLYKYETGEYDPTLYSLNAISNVFGCSIDELVGRAKPDANAEATERLLLYLIEEAACDTCGRCAYYEYNEEDDAPLCKQFPEQGHKACMRGMLEYYRKQAEAEKNEG
jgi:transcriptional regulator with XRE-family HTH domain